MARMIYEKGGYTVHVGGDDRHTSVFVLPGTVVYYYRPWVASPRWIAKRVVRCIEWVTRKVASENTAEKNLAVSTDLIVEGLKQAGVL